MKKIMAVILMGVLINAQLKANEVFDSCFDGALSTGYVFKHDDCIFKKIYGHGIQNIITADGCYYRWNIWGVGAKISYWHAHGRTTYLKQRTHLHEIPLTFYIRARQDLWCNTQGYISLGGGVVFVKEKSYLGCVNRNKGIGEFEVGLNYYLCDCIAITGAFRYLFPRECIGGQKVDVGGFDLRAGVAFTY